ncbi:hypothetical protein Ct9H90mP29_21370 [bacterium]|nr:MAG: hypothetical protein Ct9H90mP29_21370 [bacterium]
MADNTFKPQPKTPERAHISSLEQYGELYKRSINDPTEFWEEIAQRLDLG